MPFSLKAALDYWVLYDYALWTFGSDSFGSDVCFYRGLFSCEEDLTHICTVRSWSAVKVAVY